MIGDLAIAINFAKQPEKIYRISSKKRRGYYLFRRGYLCGVYFFST